MKVENGNQEEASQIGKSFSLALELSTVPPALSGCDIQPFVLTLMYYTTTKPLALMLLCCPTTVHMLLYYASWSIRL
jgi:hypothetical protein